MTRASGGDYENLNTGFTFSMISGYSVLLKIRANGEYHMEFYSSGVTSNCAFASTLEYSGEAIDLLKTYEPDTFYLSEIHLTHYQALKACKAKVRKAIWSKP
jgi:hypothetical protein